MTKIQQQSTTTIEQFFCSGITIEQGESLQARANTAITISPFLSQALNSKAAVR